MLGLLTLTSFQLPLGLCSGLLLLCLLGLSSRLLRSLLHSLPLGRLLLLLPRPDGEYARVLRRLGSISRYGSDGFTSLSTSVVIFTSVQEIFRTMQRLWRVFFRAFSAAMYTAFLASSKSVGILVSSARVAGSSAGLRSIVYWPRSIASKRA